MVGKGRDQIWEVLSPTRHVSGMLVISDPEDPREHLSRAIRGGRREKDHSVPDLSLTIDLSQAGQFAGHQAPS